MAESSNYCGPATPHSPFESYGLGYSEFARHYYRNHGCFLFLWVLRWFTSPGSLHDPMYSDDGSQCSHWLGFPIRTPPDHSLLAAPRGLSQLIASFIAYLRQGIHTHALSSLTIKSILNTDVSSLCASAFTCSKCPSIFNCQRSIQQTRQNNKIVVGLGRIELPTSPLSGVRSSQLSYRPGWASLKSWWSWSGSNRRPPECKSGALPTELQPLVRKSNRGRLDARARGPAPQPIPTSETPSRESERIWSGTTAA